MTSLTNQSHSLTRKTPSPKINNKKKNLKSKKMVPLNIMSIFFMLSVCRVWRVMTMKWKLKMIYYFPILCEPHFFWWFILQLHFKSDLQWIYSVDLQLFSETILPHACRKFYSYIWWDSKHSVLHMIRWSRTIRHSIDRFCFWTILGTQYFSTCCVLFCFCFCFL